MARDAVGPSGAQPPLTAVILTPADPAIGALVVGGLPLGVRQARMLAGAGAVVGAPSGGRTLVIDGGWLIDQRLLDALAGAPAPSVIVASGSDGGAETCVAALLDPAAAETIRQPADLTALAPATAGLRLTAASIDPYTPSARRDTPVRIQRIAYPADARAVERNLLLDAQRGVLDWPARFIDPVFEDALVRALWPTPISPNQVSLATLVLGLAGAVAFAFGAFWAGIAAALVVEVLDGVDGKLARTRLQITPMGELEHAADKIVEYAWYLALGFGLWRAGAPAHYLVLGPVAALAMFVDVWIGTTAQKLLGRQLEDAGGFERAFRLIGGRRNTHMWMLLGFGLFGAWRAGLVAIAVSAQATALIRLWRLSVRVRTTGRRLF